MNENSAKGEMGWTGAECLMRNTTKHATQHFACLAFPAYRVRGGP